MYRGLRSLNGAIVAAFLVTALVAVGGSCPAEAADPKAVVVEQFGGTGATKFREQVRKSLRDLKADVVSDKKLAATEADLGLMQASDSYPAVSSQLNASHFVSGTISGGKKPTATLVVKDSTGKRIGQKSFKGANARKLDAALKKGLRGALAELLAKGGSAPVAGGGAAETPAPETVAPVDTPPLSAAEEKRAAREEKRAAREEKRAAAAAQKTGGDRAAKKTKDEDSADEDEDAAVATAASASASSSTSAWKGLDASLGAYVYSRKFAYKQERKGDQEAYSTDPVAPAIAANIDYFFLPYLGVSAGGDYTVGLSSAKDKATFTTTAMSFYAGPKAKYNFGRLELNFLAAFAKQVFKLQDKVRVDDRDFFSNVPDADYSMVRAVLGARVDLGVVAVFGSFGYNHVLSMGTFKDAFPRATAAATEGSLGVAVPLKFLLNGLDIRLSFFARTFGIAMNSRASDDNVAGGATDKYMGGLLSVGYRTN